MNLFRPKKNLQDIIAPLGNLLNDLESYHQEEAENIQAENTLISTLQISVENRQKNREQALHVHKNVTALLNPKIPETV